MLKRSSIAFSLSGPEFLSRFVLLNVGLALYGFALALAYRAQLGLHSWGILQTSLRISCPLPMAR